MPKDARIGSRRSRLCWIIEFLLSRNFSTRSVILGGREGARERKSQMSGGQERERMGDTNRLPGAGLLAIVEADDGRELGQGEERPVDAARKMVGGGW